MTTSAQDIYRPGVFSSMAIANDGAATLERAHTVLDRDAGDIRLTSLVLVGAHSEDDTTLTLEAADAGPAQGRIPKNLVLTLDSVEYTAQADADSNTSSQWSVTISPALASDQLDGAVVTLANTASYSFPECWVDDLTERETPADLVGIVNWLCTLPYTSAVTPRRHDRVTAGGRTARVSRVGEPAGMWPLFMEA